ncbi:MAG TPA: response regulator [Verrucomicrobiae bacterium]|nr:response regulator [Verrucomicrobiae bacterium]
MKARVLIVDDEPDFLNLLQFKLAAEGFEVISAETGLEGLRRARCEAPGVIVLDMLLSDLDGLSVCEILRAQPSTRDVPIIMLSALAAPIQGPRSSRLNVSRWLTKGVGFESINQSIRSALAEHHHELTDKLLSDE